MKLFIILALILSFLSFGLSVAATDRMGEVIFVTNHFPKVKIAPTHAFYNLFKIITNIDIKLTISYKKKIKKYAKKAERCLAELDQLKISQINRYANPLLDEYGKQLIIAYSYLDKIVFKMNCSDELENQLKRVEEKLTKVNDKILRKIPFDFKFHLLNQIQLSKEKTLIQFPQRDLFYALHQMGYGTSTILKLHAISEMTSVPIRHLIGIENQELKIIDFNSLLVRYGLTKEDVKARLLEYKKMQE